MSTRKWSLRKVPSRKVKEGRKIYISPEDMPEDVSEDVPLSSLAAVKERQPKSKKKSPPRKKLMRTRAATAASSEIVNLDDIPEANEIFNNVNSKIGNFMQSGSFISSDEDETEMIKAKTNKKPSPNPFFISDDSDDDCKIVKPPNVSLDLDFSTPSTSAGTSKSNSRDNNMKSFNEDIMNYVDSFLDKQNNEQSPLKDMKSLEDYRKETEEMLKNASSLLDEIKTGCKLPPEEKNKEETSPKVTVGACPVCLESLGNRPASVTVCGHIFCKECIVHTAQTLKKCPTCRKTINSKKIHPIYF